METDVFIRVHEAPKGIFNERQKRLHATAEAKALGHGGVKRVRQAGVREDRF
jgi:hypothetical protein